MPLIPYQSLLALLCGVILMMAGAGSLTTVLSIRLEQASVTAPAIGLVMAAYFAGTTLGSLFASRVILRVGHIRRLLLKKDAMGFSLHDTIIHAGTETHIWYQNHLEAVYCIEGEGEVETLADGVIHPIKAGMVYALDKHDRHLLRAKTQMRMVCVFNPPLTGQETHDANGVYPLLSDDAA